MLRELKANLYADAHLSHLCISIRLVTYRRQESVSFFSLHFLFSVIGLISFPISRHLEWECRRGRTKGFLLSNLVVSSSLPYELKMWDRLVKALYTWYLYVQMCSYSCNMQGLFDMHRMSVIVFGFLTTAMFCIYCVATHIGKKLHIVFVRF